MCYYRVNDHIISANGFSLEHADYAAVIAIMKEAEHLNMVGIFSDVFYIS